MAAVPYEQPLQPLQLPPLQPPPVPLELPLAPK